MLTNQITKIQYRFKKPHINEVNDFNKFRKCKKAKKIMNPIFKFQVNLSHVPSFSFGIKHSQYLGNFMDLKAPAAGH